MVHKSNFTIDNIVLKSTFNDINSKYVFIFLIYLQNRNFRMTNIDTRTSGTIVYTSDPLNVFLENIDVDYSRNNCGFFIGTYWNYPEAYTDSTINSTNIKFYYGAGETLVSKSDWYPFSSSAPGTITLTKIYFDIYSTIDEMVSDSCLYSYVVLIQYHQWHSLHKFQRYLSNDVNTKLSSNEDKCVCTWFITWSLSYAKYFNK